MAQGRCGMENNGEEQGQGGALAGARVQGVQARVSGRPQMSGRLRGDGGLF